VGTPHAIGVRGDEVVAERVERVLDGASIPVTTR
jgi:hypothetical protein